MFRAGKRLVRLYNAAGVCIGTMVVVLGSAVICHADFTPPTLSTAEYTAVAGAIFTALGAIWGLRKVIKLLNKS